jgi:Uri superfamily endonuclease
VNNPTATNSRPGTYALFLAPRQQGTIRIGRLGPLTLNGVDEVFLYVGRALGPGGVAARCRHHHRIAPRSHWHLDYLRPYCDLIGVWVSFGQQRLEHHWAQAFGAWPGARWPLPGFGASDCRCPAHLIALPEVPISCHLHQNLGAGEWLEPAPWHVPGKPGGIPS